MRIGKASLLVLASALTCLGIQAAFAQSYPNRPIRLIVAFPAGGTSDLVTRAVGRSLAKYLNGNVVVDNRPGASTKIGTLEVVKAAPDGHTLLVASLDATQAYYYSGIFDTKVWDELTVLGRAGEMSWGMLEVRGDSPFRSWNDIVAHAKKNPGKLNAGGPATGGMMNMIALETAKNAGIDVAYVAFAGSAPSGTALLGGHIDYRVVQPADVVANHRAGKTRGIAIAFPQRIPEMSDVPTFQEAGIPFDPPVLGFDLWAPPGLPAPLTRQLMAALQQTVKDPEFVETAKRLLLHPRYLTPEELKEKARNFEKGLGPRLEAAFPKK